MNKIFIGIDFSKKKFDATAITADGLNETGDRKYDTFSNDVKGFRKFAKWCKGISGGIDPEDWLFCGEDTGGYSHPLSSWLYSHGYNIWLENALRIKGCNALKRLKDDKVDSAMIADYAMRHADKVVLWRPLGESLSQLRELFLYRHRLVRHRCSFEVRNSEKNLTLEKSPVKKLMRHSSDRIIAQINREIAQCEKAIRELIASDEEINRIYGIITSMPGIGMINAVCLIVYTENFRRFGFNARKIATYYGVAPFGKYSGTSIHTEPHVSPFANRTIKSLLSQAALAAIRFNPMIHAYYHALIDRGKDKNLARNNVKCKLIRIITAMVRQGIAFDHNYNENKIVCLSA